MSKVLTLEEVCRIKMAALPEHLRREIGQFNVFRTADFIGPQARKTPYSRKDFYKISLVVGRNKYDYADKSITIEKNALLFGNPQVPYRWEPLEETQAGFFCIFTEAFINQYSNIKLQDFPMFNPGGQPVYLLDDTQLQAVSVVFEKMFTEIGSDYLYKYDLLRNYTLELIHGALKLQPAATLHHHTIASDRISWSFIELLERQFPIESSRQQLNLRSAADFARQLSVHVNHLNRALKEVTGKTTSDLIADRIVQEAKALLKHTDWNIAEVGYSLGFDEPAHFNNFFKRKTNQTPRSYRIV